MLPPYRGYQQQASGLYLPRGLMGCSNADYYEGVAGEGPAFSAGAGTIAALIRLWGGGTVQQIWGNRGNTQKGCFLDIFSGAGFRFAHFISGTSTVIANTRALAQEDFGQVHFVVFSMGTGAGATKAYLNGSNTGATNGDNTGYVAPDASYPWTFGNWNPHTGPSAKSAEIISFVACNAYSMTAADVTTAFAGVRTTGKIPALPNETYRLDFAGCPPIIYDQVGGKAVSRVGTPSPFYTGSP